VNHRKLAAIAALARSVPRDEAKVILGVLDPFLTREEWKELAAIFSCKPPVETALTALQKADSEQPAPRRLVGRFA
jgi:hypothetical protein